MVGGGGGWWLVVVVAGGGWWWPRSEDVAEGESVIVLRANNGCCIPVFIEVTLYTYFSVLCLNVFATMQ